MKRKLKMIGVILGVMILTSIASVYAVQAVNSIDVSYDNSTSGLSSSNVKGAIDELYAKQKSICSLKDIPLITYLRLCLGTNSTVLQDDKTAGHNMRYIGATPNNYITFNGETAGWRIIGVFGSDSHGKSEELVKIQRSTVLKNGSSNIPWDSNNKNDWSIATGQIYLNETYLPTLTTNNAKDMIQEVNWKVGGNVLQTEEMYGNKFYEHERGNTGAGANSELIEWTGKIALAYPSDYIFSTNGGSTYNRSFCLNQPARDMSGNSIYWKTTSPRGECAAGSWMTQLLEGIEPWLLTPFSNNENSAFIGVSNISGGSIGYRASVANPNSPMLPALYLKSSVICTNCSDSDAGSSSNPFQLSYIEG